MNSNVKAHDRRTNSEDVFAKAKTASISSVIASLGIAVGKQNKFLCPIHEADGQPHRPSADFDESRNLWKCRACHTSQGPGQTSIDLVMVRNGLNPLEAAHWICDNVLHAPQPQRQDNTVKPLANGKGYESPEAAAASIFKGRAISVYSYAEDKAVIRADAGGDKSILPVHKDSAGRWHTKKGDSGKWPLYGLYGREIFSGQTIVIVEGEKCADAINATNGQFVAVTSQGGSKAAAQADWTTLPSGYEVVIWPDNDDTGQGYADAVIEEIVKADRWPQQGLKVIAPPEDWPAKHDAADELQELSSTQADDRIHKTIQAHAKPVDSPAEALAKANANGLKSLGLVKADTIESKPINWIVKGVMARGELTLICGEAGSGKTKVAIAIAAHLTTGNPIDGLPIEGGPQNIAIISFEEDPGRMIKPVAEISGMDLDRAYIYDAENANIKTLADLEECFDRLAKAHVRYILIDSLTALYARLNRDIIDSKAPYEIHGAINKAARKHDLCIDLIHHYGKASGKSHDNHNKSAGSFAITASVRSVKQVEVDKATGSRFLGVAPNKNNLGLRPHQVLAFRTTKTREDLNSGEGYVIAELYGWNTTETIEDIGARLTKAQNDHIRGQVKPRHLEAAEAAQAFLATRNGVCRADELDSHMLNAGYTEKATRNAKAAMKIDKHRHPDRQNKMKGEYFLTILPKAEALDIIRRDYKPNE